LPVTEGGNVNFVMSSMRAMLAEILMND
jgi:hypothetical protein